MAIGLTLALAAALTACTATDGDSLRCGQERIRLLGIDAPEMGKCPPRRKCAPGDPVASRENLRRLIRGHKPTVERIKKDRYGRTIGVVRAGGVNLSCAQLGGGFAVYRGDWDDGGRVRRGCR